MKKTQSQLKLLLAALLCAFVVSSKGQPNLLGVWPVADPIAYINFYDNNTSSIDTNWQWGQNYFQSNSAAVIFDNDTQLLFQTGGSKVVNKKGLTIENGDSLIDNKFYQYYGYSGLANTQGVIALPRDANTWWVFNMSFSDSGFTNGTAYSPDRLYGAVVDVSANGGAGKVTAKKIPIYKGIMGDCRLTACRHANGRDWWLVNHGWNNNLFNKWLVTSDSIYGPFRDSVGTLHKEPDIYGMAQFTLDGTKYAMGSENGLVNILDFDRCTGQFSNLRTLNNYVEPPWSTFPEVSSIDGLCFSPNGRYLYLAAFKYLTQYDIEADTIDSTRVLIAKYDTSYVNTEPFFTMALTPQGKIMISNFQGVSNSRFHIIHNPDSAGFACNFHREELDIPGALGNFTLPNIVNLKLGKMLGSECDTLTDIRHKTIDNRQRQIQVFPNPAKDMVFIESEQTTQGELTIADELGRLLYTNPHFDGATAIKVNNWMNGIYFYRLRTTSNEQQSGKIVVQH